MNKDGFFVRGSKEAPICGWPDSEPRKWQSFYVFAKTMPDAAQSVVEILAPADKLKETSYLVQIPECGSNYKADTRKGVAVEYITKSA